MSSGNKFTLNPAVGPDALPVMLSPEEVVQVLRSLRQQIALPSGELATVSSQRRITHVNAKFIEAAINAIGAAAGVPQVLGRSDEELRLEVDASARWTAVADELRSLLASIVVANTVRRQRIGLTALQTYKICEQLARDGSNERLNAHVREMRRLNKFGRRRKSSPAAPAPEEPFRSQQTGAKQ